ncbi:TetR/AcrR family transcriptional regulator [Roseburia sp. 831b]|uniref:TetR/AcrR family transcriptional regulator n=1 Tax=Roseburia sp. 831b TaxID=1261635 RepID=UPI000ACA738B|nr:TetR/AcrR family transcriptional regulator [Roseburia sp. 831b]MDY5884178.1 TetR/AcrR family transcriptional regulator [Roseburia sp.]WVK74509.1 TetR/AcrR family transcriptional regulator [Roseburia sp. 831b]
MMKNKEETMQKIKQAALDEFYDKGYAKASLRTICNRAGVTTGAMYFSFENKEALLRAILEPLIENYEKMLAEYMKIEMENQQESAKLDVLLMQFILKHRKETIIIMEKAQGSCYEGYRRKIEKMMEQSFFAYYQSRLKVSPDEGLMKLLARQRLDSCLEIIKEDYDMQYSLYLVEQTGIYAEGGTDRLIQSLEKLHSN